MKLDNSVARSAWYLAIARINQPHVALFAEGDDSNGADISTFTKLMNKQMAFLRGELKSRDNLMRFFNDFSEWRNELELDDDSLGDAIVDLTLSALYASVESVFDPESDDVELLNDFVVRCQDEMVELDSDYAGLKDYFADIQQEFTDQFGAVRQIPVGKVYFDWLKELDVSLFGLEA